MANKTERIEMRADPDSGARITEAAKLANQTVSTFVLEAANAAADRMLARTDVTVMPADQFDALMASLDEPDDMGALARVARRPRRFTRS